MSLVHRCLGSETVYRFHTVLPVEECRERLEAAIGSDLILSEPNWNTNVLGEVSGERFELQLGKYTRNALTLHFYGRLAETPGGTEVSGRVRPPTGAVVLFTAIIGFMLFVFLNVFPRLILSGQPVAVFTLSSAISIVVIIPIAVVAVVLIMRYDRGQTPGAETELTQLVQDVLLTAKGPGPKDMAGVVRIRVDSHRTAYNTYASRTRILRRINSSLVGLTILTVVGLMLAGNRGLLDPERYLPYVFGCFGVVYGSFLAIFASDHDRMNRRYFGPEGARWSTRWMGLFFIFVGALMIAMTARSMP